MLEMLLRTSDTKERCGFVLADGTIVEIDNIAADPETSFEMDMTQALTYLNDEEAIEATWHTHPGGDPNLSGEDYMCFLAWPDLNHIIVGVFEGRVATRIYRVEEGLVIACD